MKIVALVALLLPLAFLPFMKINLYEWWAEIFKTIMPELFWEIEKAVRKAGLPKSWEKYLLLAFSLSVPLGVLYLVVAHTYWEISLGNFVLISLSSFLLYGYVYFKGGIRYRNMNNDVRQVYRVLRLELTAGGSGEDAIRKSLKYTSEITPALEGLLVNWGNAEYELLKIKEEINIPVFDTLVSFLFEVKRAVTPSLIASIERQERSLAINQRREIERANKRDEAFNNVFYFLFMFSQFYLLVKPLIIESTRVFNAF